MEIDSKNMNKRAVNFTRSEENMLVLLVKKYAHIIENKKTDSCANQKKAVTWVQITNEFNSTGGDTYRSLNILKNKYLNMKKKSVKKFSNEKKLAYVTGGGPPVNFIDDEIDVGIKEIIGSRMTGFTSEFDSDTIDQHQENIYEENSNENVIEVVHTDTLGLDQQEELTFVIEADENESVQIEQNNWSKNGVDNLRTPVSTKLAVNHPKDIRKRDNTLKTKLSNWAKAKQDCVSIQQQCILDEYKQKLRFNEEKHQEDLKQKREVHEKNMVMIQEEHEIKISILKLQRQKLLKELSE